jgi:hypothetical protein
LKHVDILPHPFQTSKLSRYYDRVGTRGDCADVVSRHQAARLPSLNVSSVAGLALVQGVPAALVLGRDSFCG